MTESPVVVAGTEHATRVTTVDADNPWPGPEAFREADARFFFGRERARDALTRLVLQNRLVILYGRSGLGKTSLLRAGVFPLLREALSLPVYVRLRFAAPAADLTRDLRGQVQAAVEAAAADALVEVPALDAGVTLWESFYSSSARFFNERSRRVRPVLVFDQFEEAFTHGRRTPALAAATDQFLEELIDLVRGSVPPSVARLFEQDPARALTFATDRDPCGVLLGCRQEFLAELLRLRSRLPSLLDRRFELTGMTLEDAGRVVTGPGGHLVDSGVDELIVKFVAAARRSTDDHTIDDTTVDPAILSIFCRELNTTRRDQKLPRITKELVTGKQDAIIADFYRRSVADLPAQLHQFVEERLITDSGYRNSAAVEEALRTPGVTKDAIDLLIERRLVRQEGSGPRSRLELTHDVLTEPILQSRNLRRVREREQRAREAEEQARHAAQDAAQREHERRQLRTQRRASLALLTLLALSLWLAWKTSEASRVAQQSLASSHIEQGIGLMISGRPDHGVAYVAQAMREDRDNVTARSLALDAILHRNWPVPTANAQHEGPALWAQFDSTGGSAVSASSDKTARVWRVADGQAQGPPLRHGGSVFFARFGRDSDTVVTIAEDGFARRWSVARGVEVARYDHSLSQVTWAALGPSDNHFATGARDGTLRLWANAHSPPIRAHRDAILDVVFDGTGDRILTASADATAALWDSRTGRELIRLKGHADVIQTARFSPDTHLLVTASRDGTAVIWHARTGKPLRTLRHSSAVVAAEFDREGTRVVTASENAARVWDVRTGNALGAPLAHDGPVRAAIFSPEGLRIATMSNDQVSVWNADDAARAGEPIRLDATAASIAFSPDGQRLITASADGAALVWDVRTGAAVPPAFRAACDVISVAFSSQSAEEVAIGCGAGSVTLWNPRTNESRPSVSNPAWVGLRSIEFNSASGVMLVVATDTATVWQPARETVSATLRHGGVIRSATFSPDGRLVATAGSDGTARIWETASGRQVVAAAAGREVWNVHFNHEGTRIITTAADNTAQIWDARSGARVGPAIPTGEPADARLGRDGTRALISTPSLTRLVDTATGETVVELAELAPLALFDPAGDVIVTVGRVAQLWDAATGRLTATLSDPSPPLNAEFSSDGRRLLTVHANGRFRVWDGRTGQAQNQPRSVDHEPRGVAATRLAPSGQRIAIAEVDGTVRLWDVPTGSRDDAGALADLVESVVGYRLNEHGAVERMPAGSRAAGRGTKGLAARVRAWAHADRASRTIGPFTEVTVDAYVKRQLASDSAEAKREAQRLFPWDRRLSAAPLVSAAAPAAAR